MIHDVDDSLRALIARDALNGSGVDVAFDAPTKDWVARRNAPVVNLYLYDIREDLSRRDTAWVDVRDEDGRVKERRLPPRRFRLSYLATAWTNRPEDEHRLLSALLAGFLRHEYFPPELLTGALEGEEVPVLLTVALPPADERKIADTWSALGGELKPSLDVVVTAPLSIARSIEAGPPVLEAPRLEVVRSDESAAAAGSTAGDDGPARPKAGSRVRASGRARPPEGRAKRADGGARPAAATDSPRPDRPDRDAPARESALPDEVFTVGGPDAPGRVLRVRQLPRR